MRSTAGKQGAREATTIRVARGASLRRASRLAALALGLALGAGCPDIETIDTTGPDISLPDTTAPGPDAPSVVGPDPALPDTSAPDGPSAPSVVGPDPNLPDTTGPSVDVPDATAPGTPK